MTQLAIPVDVDFAALGRKKTMGAALGECIELAGLDVKQLSFDKAQVSRWLSDGEGIKWEKFCELMDACGNDAPLIWMLIQRGYDPHSIRKTESETEKALRLSREENSALRRALREQL